MTIRVVGVRCALRQERRRPDRGEGWVRVDLFSRLLLRAFVASLTDALAGRGLEDAIRLEPSTLRIVVDSTLDDVDDRPSPVGFLVPPPDGLFEWRVRRDFVRSLPPGNEKRRLGQTLAGPKTRRRFEVLLAARGEPLHRAFGRFRRRRLRGYAARVVRFALAATQWSTSE